MQAEREAEDCAHTVLRLRQQGEGARADDATRHALLPSFSNSKALSAYLVADLGVDRTLLATTRKADKLSTDDKVCV